MFTLKPIFYLIHLLSNAIVKYKSMIYCMQIKRSDTSKHTGLVTFITSIKRLAGICRLVRESHFTDKPCLAIYEWLPYSV